MLRELGSGWADRAQESMVRAARWKDLPPFDELEHPAIQSTRLFDENPENARFTRHEGATRAAGYSVVEARDKAKGPGWRTAIITTEGESWAVYADTHDDFHRSVESKFKAIRAQLEPTKDDQDWRRFKSNEQAAREALSTWREGIVRNTLAAFGEAWASTELSVVKSLPEPPSAMLPAGLSQLNASIDIELLRESDDDGGDLGKIEPQDDSMFVEVILHIAPQLNHGDPIADQVMKTVLPAIVAGEDRWQASYTKSGALTHTVVLSGEELERLLFAGEVEGELSIGVAEPQPTTKAHYVSASTIVDSVVNGSAVRSACGVWLVSRQNPEGMPVCEKCVEQLPDMSFVKELLTRRLLDG
jgi:hypothetical protein